MCAKKITRRLCGAAVLLGLTVGLPAEAGDDAIPVSTLTYRVVKDQPADAQTNVQTVGFRFGHRHFGHRHYGYRGYGYRGYGGYGFSIGYRPSYYGYSFYRPYRSYYRPRYYGYSYYRPRYYGYAYYRPRVYSYSYYRPQYIGGYSYAYAPTYVVPSYRGALYHGSYGYGSAYCY